MISRKCLLLSPFVHRKCSFSELTNVRHNFYSTMGRNIYCLLQVEAAPRILIPTRTVHHRYGTPNTSTRFFRRDSVQVSLHTIARDSTHVVISAVGLSHHAQWCARFDPLHQVKMYEYWTVECKRVRFIFWQANFRYRRMRSCSSKFTIIRAHS